MYIYISSFGPEFTGIVGKSKEWLIGVPNFGALDVSILLLYINEH